MATFLSYLICVIDNVTSWCPCSNHVCYSRQGTSAGNSLLSTVCSDPQALLSPQWKWNWHSLNLSCRGPPFSAAPESQRTCRAVRHTFHNPLKMGLKNGSNICQYQYLLPLLKRGYDPTQDVSWGTGCSVTNTNLETRKYYSERPIKQ